MADRYPGDDAARNGFGRQWLTAYECQLLHECGYPAPPDFRVAPGWALSAGGVPVPPVPKGNGFLVQVELVRSAMRAAEHADPAHHLGNHAAWGAFFEQLRQAQLAVFDGPPPAPKRKSSAGRLAFWGVKGRMLQHVIGHIEGGNTPPLGFPAAALPPPTSLSRRRGLSSSIPRRMTTPASSLSTSASHSSGTAPVFSSLVKREVPASPTRSPPRTRARALSIVITELAPPTPPTAFIRRRFRQGDDGQGCSSQQPSKPTPPSSDDDDDGGGKDINIRKLH